MDMYALSLIFSDYVMDCSNKHLSVRSNAFKQISFKCWAADALQIEICKKIFPRETCQITEIENIIKEFEARMIKYSYKSKKNRLAFVVAQDVATDILDILKSIES